MVKMVNIICFYHKKKKEKIEKENCNRSYFFLLCPSQPFMLYKGVKNYSRALCLSSQTTLQKQPASTLLSE